jgi:hypothetical protein
MTATEIADRVLVLRKSNPQLGFVQVVALVETELGRRLSASEERHAETRWLNMRD